MIVYNNTVSKDNTATPPIHHAIRPRQDRRVWYNKAPKSTKAYYYNITMYR